MESKLTEGDDRRPLIKAPKAAARLGITERHLRTLVSAGELRRVRLGRRCVRFDERDIDTFIESRKS